MSNHLVKNCRSHDQLEKIRKGQERKFRWRDDWPVMEKALLEAGAEAIAAHEAEEQKTPDDTKSV